MADRAEYETAENVGANPNMHEREGAEAQCPVCYGTGKVGLGDMCCTCCGTGRVPVEGPERMLTDYGGKASIDW
jgi:RecJ-like exonuclease